MGISLVFNSLDATAIALAASLLSSGVAFFRSNVTLAFFNNLTKVLSKFKIFVSPKFKSFRIYPFPEPGAPANMRAFGLPVASLSNSINLIILKYLL